MKGKVPTLFPKKRRERRGLGQIVASVVMILCLAVAGTTPYTVALAQPEVLTVEPGQVWQMKQETRPAVEAEGESEAETSSTSQQMAEPEVEVQPETARPEEETPVQQPGAETPAAEPETPVSQPETAPQPTESQIPAYEIQQQLGQENGQAAALSSSPWNTETPALSAEDPLASRYELSQAGDGSQSPQQLLLTPDQLNTLMESEYSLGLTQENFMDWLLGSNQNSFLRWLLELLFGSLGGQEEEYSGWKTIDGKTYYYDPETHLAITGIQTIDGKIYYFDPDGVKQDVTFGIDVSKYQTNVDWKKVKEAGAEFAIIRIGYRGYSTGALALDPLFESHLAGAQAAGLRVGVYIFSQAITVEEAREEAFACAYVLNGRQLDYPIYFDSEYAVPGALTGRADRLTKEERTAIAVAFCEEVKLYGYEPGVYASTSWFSSHLDLNALTSYKIWNAHYGISAPRMGCDMWQGTCEGRISGINGNVDINISYVG